MSAALTSDRRVLLCDRAGHRPMTRPVLAGIGLAVAVHAGLALYIINERFEIIVPPAPPEVIMEGATITIEKPKPEPKPVEDQPVKQTQVKIHTPVNVSPTVTDTIPVTPTPPDVTGRSGPARWAGAWRWRSGRGRRSACSPRRHPPNSSSWRSSTSAAPAPPACVPPRGRFLRRRVTGPWHAARGAPDRMSGAPRELC